jgi:hypothetical protein
MVTGNQHCSRYCWGPLHIHPQSENLSNDLWMIGKTLAQIPSFFEEAAAYQDPHRPVQPLIERVVDNIFLGLVGVTALGASPVVVAGAGVAYIGERVLGTVDALHGAAEKTHVFGEALKEQRTLIENFGPLLELTDKIPLLAERAEKKAEAYEENSRKLDELQSNFASKPDVFEKVERVVARLNELLPKMLQEKTSTGMNALLLKQRLEIVHNISEEERKIKELQARLQGMMSRVQEKDEKLQRLKGQVTYSTQQKDHLISAVAIAQEGVVISPKKETSDGRMGVV